MLPISCCEANDFQLPGQTASSSLIDDDRFAHRSASYTVRESLSSKVLDGQRLWQQQVGPEKCYREAHELCRPPVSIFRQDFDLAAAASSAEPAVVWDFAVKLDKLSRHAEVLSK